MILVTGATGFVGSHIIRRLLQERWEVRCLVRDPARLWAYRGRYSLVQGDLLDSKAVASAMQGVEGVIHLVGISHTTKGATFEDIHVKATKNLIETARANAVSRFIHMSALGSKPDCASRYHQTKWKAEEAVRTSGLEYTIFRPSIIFGPEDEFINRLIKIIRLLPVLPHFGWGRVQPIWVEDVAHCFVRSLEDPSTIGRTFDLGGTQVFSLDELIELLGHLLKIEKVRLNAPQWLLWAGAKMLEMTPNPPLTREQLLLLEEDNTCDIGAMIGAFQLEPRDLEDYLREFLRLEKEPGARNQANSAGSPRTD